MAIAQLFTPQRTLLAAALMAWICVAIDSPWQQLATGSHTAFAAVLNTWGWALWVCVAIAFLVPSPISLTAIRCITPISVVGALWSTTPLAVFGAVVALIISFSPLCVDVMVQGGAYGEEKRFALRTPVPQMAPTFVAWSILVVTLIGGTLLLGNRQFVMGIPITLIGVVLATRVPRMLHRHSRRWLVIVPAGIVVHDYLVLAETIMSPRSKIASISVITEPGETADFTGGVAGRRIAVQLRDADKIVLSKITARLLGTTEALHVKTFSVAPRRLNAALSAIKL